MRLRPLFAWAGAAGLTAAGLAMTAFGSDGATGASPAAVAKELDAILADAWKSHGLRPAGVCTDEEFVRRVHLDLVGTVPTVEQVEAFLADRAPDRRARLVETLLTTPGYARNFANRWAEVLVGEGVGEKEREFVPFLFRGWLEQQLAQRRPYGEIVTEMLTATGTVYSSPPLNFQGRRDHNPTDVAGAVSKSFLGVQIQCAQCHDHPYEELTQQDFRGLAAFFARVTQRPTDIPYEMLGPRAVERYRERQEKQVQDLVKQGVPEAEARLRAERMQPKIVEIGDLTGDVRVPRRFEQRREQMLGEVAKTAPKFLRGGLYKDETGTTRRQALARWVADPANGYTANALANRYWGWLLGRGFVHPEDDFSSANLPTVPEALELLARDTAAHRFDLDRLVRIITATRAYQLSSAVPGRTPKHDELFAAGPLKPLSPQQTFDSLQVALGVVKDGRAMSGLEGGVPSAIDMESRSGGMMAMEEGGRDRSKQALSLAARSFFTTFDDDEGGGSEAFEGTIPQGLFLMNSRVVNGLLSNPQVSAIPSVVKDHATEKARIRHLFLRTLAREPSDAELRRFVEFVKTAPEADEPKPQAGGRKGRRGRGGRGAPEPAELVAYADVLWALVASSEFSTNH